VRAVCTIPDRDADPHFRSQHSFVCDPAGHIAVDLVGRYERLPEDVRAVERRLGLPALALPRLQAARTVMPYTAFYTAETAHLVAQRYAHDAALFGYRPPAGG
jgi:Sulfotransferase family